MGDELSGMIARSGLVEPGERGVVLVSGGADSVTLLVGLAGLLGPENLAVLHVNYGLREGADDEEALVRRLCTELGVACDVRRAGDPEGNLQAWARELRLEEAERLRVERSMDWIAVGHNRSDQVETFLYRLASSPGVRPLLAMPPRSGRLIRPLIRFGAGEIREAADRQGLAYAEDPSNEQREFARNRIRLDVIPLLESVNRGVELNIVRTRAELEEDEDLLEEIARQASDGFLGPDRGALPIGVLRRHHPAIQRRVLRLLAESALGRHVPVSTRDTVEVLRLADVAEGGEVDLGGGACLAVESGLIRLLEKRTTLVEPGEAEIPCRGGSVDFGDWRITTELIDPGEARAEFGALWSAFFDGEELRRVGLKVRTRRSGDRIDPLGLDGSRLLQDVFVDAGVPRSKRAFWPVFEAAGEIVWVPGLTVSRHHLVAGHTKRVLKVHADTPSDPWRS